MDLQKLHHYISQVKKNRSESVPKLRSLIRKQLNNLSHCINKRDAMSPNQERMNLNRIHNGIKSNSKKDILKGTLHIYADIYYTDNKTARYLQFNLTKLLKAQDNNKQPDIVNISKNVLLKRFGLGNTFRILEVHSSISIIRNVPLTMVTIKYI